MSTGKGIKWVVPALVAAFAVAAQPALAGKKPKSKPDFAVKSVAILGDTPYHVLLDRTDSGLVLDVKVKNQGKTASDGNGTLTVRGSGILRPTKFNFEVPKIKPGKSETFQVEIKGSALDGITTYRTEVCASAKDDAKPGNACRSGPDFAAIPKTWVGSANATWSDGLTIQSLVANPVTFTFDRDKTIQTRTFVYDATGTLTGTITGDHTPDCEFSGTGDTALDPEQSTLSFEPSLTVYRAEARIVSTTKYAGHYACNDGQNGPWAQEYGTWLYTENVAREPQDEVLTGSVLDSIGDSWTWNFRAE